MLRISNRKSGRWLYECKKGSWRERAAGEEGQRERKGSGRERELEVMMSDKRLPACDGSGFEGGGFVCLSNQTLVLFSNNATRSDAQTHLAIHSHFYLPISSV